MDENSPVLVTGGTGTLGSSVVAELRSRSLPLRVLTRRPRPEDPVIFPGDLSTGEGLQQAVLGVRAVIHCATQPVRSRAVDVEGTLRLLDTVVEIAPQAHVVYISIVGCDHSPLAYYRIKARVEGLLSEAAAERGSRVSIVRATQFQELVRTVARIPPKGPVGLAFRGMRFQACDTEFVARHLVDTALGTPRSERLEVAGPEVVSVPEAVRLTADHEGRRRPRVLMLPAVGATLRAFADGRNLPGTGAVLGGTTYAEWLAEHDKGP